MAASDSSGLSDLPAPDSVVITGAAGWLGKNFVRAVAGNRKQVRCLVQNADERALLEVAGSSVEVVVGDVRDPSALDRLFDDVAGATVFHAAGVIHPQSAVRELFDVNVGGTELVLDQARRANAGRFIHVSSNSPFGANPTPSHVFTEDSPYNPYMGYGKSKFEAEQLVKRASDRGDLETVIVRAPWFYGPHQPDRQTQWFRAVARGRFPMLGDGTQRRSMVYTENLVDGMLRAEVAGAAPGRAYWIADAEPYEMRSILGTVRDALSAEGVSVTERTPRIPLFAGVIAEHVDGFLQGRGRYMQAMHVLGELKDTIACDITRAGEELGYEPKMALLEGMRTSIRWCIERGEQF